MTAYLIGEEEVVMGFGLIGIPGYTPRDRDDALREFGAAQERPSPCLILLTESVADSITAEIRAALLKGAMVQVIQGIRPSSGRGEDVEALLLSALGIKL